MSVKDFAMGLIKNNPQIANNPNASEMLNAIQNGDNAKGQQIANNLCRTYGMTPEQALAQAKKFFGIR